MHRISLSIIQICVDPFLDLIRLLRPRATLWSKVEASARWGLQFQRHDDLLFCWIERGRCELMRPGFAPLLLRADDFVLVRTSMPFSLVSGADVEAIDSEAIITGSGSLATLGDGQHPSTVIRGGKFVFDTANEQLLAGLLPQIACVKATDDSSERVRSLLEMNEAESSAPGPGSEFVIARLVELVLVEILRSKNFAPDHAPTGLLAGLADPITAKALTAIHSQVARPWTAEKLARVCGCSRSAFAARFARVVGSGPIEYLQQWRIALAKDELRRGGRNIGEIALAVGFQSSSAFSTAFTRAVGCSPKRFAERFRATAIP